jgi:hypothetical protein
VVAAPRDGACCSECDHGVCPPQHPISVLKDRENYNVLEAASATIDITPEGNQPTACHGPRNAPSVGVGYSLEANVLGLRDGDMVVVIVTLDWFFSSPGLRMAIMTKCASQLRDSDLIVAASHTHTSPNPDPAKVAFSSVDPEYVAWVEGRISNAVHEMLSTSAWHSAKLRFSKSHCDCAIHRRREIWMLGRRGIRRAMSIFPNPTGPNDNELRLLRVEDENGNLLAVVWGISCHPTDWPVLGELSSDFPGGVRIAIRQAAAEGVPVLFLQGYCGTLRPKSIGRWPRNGSWRSRLITLAQVLLNGPGFAGFTPREYALWLQGIANDAKRALVHAAGRDLAVNLQTARLSVPLSALGISGAADPLFVQKVSLGESLTIVGISAEVCWEYAEPIKARLKAAELWPVGYIDHAFGYLPVNSMLVEGGYEVEGFMPRFGISGAFVPNVEQVVLKLVEECLQN